MQSTTHSVDTGEKNSRQRSHATHEKIAQRAFQLFISEGCPTGRTLDNWLAAEREYELEYSHNPAMPCGCGHTSITGDEESVRTKQLFTDRLNSSLNRKLVI